MPDATVLLVLGDPTDEFFQTTSLGMNANGSVPGYIYLNVWPSPENLARLEATAVHELHHNVRYAPGNVVWDPATVTVGEYVVSEGSADAFARELYGEEHGRPGSGSRAGRRRGNRSSSHRARCHRDAELHCLGARGCARNEIRR